MPFRVGASIPLVTAFRQQERVNYTITINALIRNLRKIQNSVLTRKSDRLLVIGEGLQDGFGQGAQVPGESLQGCVGIGTLHPGQKHKTAAALHQGANGAAVVSSFAA